MFGKTLFLYCSRRIGSKLLCYMDLHNYPFDWQTCSMNMELYGSAMDKAQVGSVFQKINYQAASAMQKPNTVYQIRLWFGYMSLLLLYCVREALETPSSTIFERNICRNRTDASQGSVRYAHHCTYEPDLFNCFVLQISWEAKDEQPIKVARMPEADFKFVKSWCQQSVSVWSRG